MERTGVQDKTEFFWDANGRLVESVCCEKKSYQYDLLGRRISNEEFYLYHNEPNGCPSRLLDESGKVVWAARYDAWGRVKKLPVDEVDQPLRLQGQYFDEETGLHYNRFRYYCAEIGSFVSQDPLGLLAGENVYGFGPNAQKWIDPLGLCKGSKKPKGATFEGRIYRSVKDGYNPLEMNSYTVNSNHRYTQPGTEGLYFSTGAKIVEAELASYKTGMAGRGMYSYDVKLDNMLDLSNPKVRNQLSVKLDDLLTNDYRTNIGKATTHQLGEFAKGNGYNGLLAPSSRADGGLNVILFNPGLVH